jgi:hypothetical protein
MAWIGEKFGLPLRGESSFFAAGLGKIQGFYNLCASGIAGNVGKTGRAPSRRFSLVLGQDLRMSRWHL